MISRGELEAREERILAPHAAKSARSLGRRHAEPEHPFRTAFQRDRDRVVHSSAFRRLQYKTQVFLVHEGDHFRTRMTHSMEAAQVARTISRALGLNEDLTEVLALAHDLGHPPFGHAGEEALGECLAEHGETFEHNLQGLRIVERLEERYPRFPGLNLTFETRESMRKHTWPPKIAVEPEYRPEWAPLLEAQVVDWADSIAYDAHDVDDAVKAGLLTEGQLAELEIWREAAADDPPADAELRVKKAVRRLIDLVVTDLLETTAANVKRLGVRSVDDVRAAREAIVGLSPPRARQKALLQGFLHRNVYRHHQVSKMNEKAKRFVRDLVRAYVQKVEQLPPRFREMANEAGVPRAVADYVAGMTDRYAQEEYRKMFHPFENIL